MLSRIANEQILWLAFYIIIILQNSVKHPSFLEYFLSNYNIFYLKMKNKKNKNIYVQQPLFLQLLEHLHSASNHQLFFKIIRLK